MLSMSVAHIFVTLAQVAHIDHVNVREFAQRARSPHDRVSVFRECVSTTSPLLKLIVPQSHRNKSDHIFAADQSAILSLVHGNSAVFIATDAKLSKATVANHDSAGST